MLDQRLQIGGLQVGGPRTAQNPARFRVANNVYPSTDDYLIPRFGNKDHITLDNPDLTIIAVAQYKLKVFTVSTMSTGRFVFTYDNNEVLPAVPQYIPFFVPPNPSDVLSLGIQFIENQGCLFFNIPILGLFKFDGIQVYRAGVSTPFINSSNYSSIGTTFVRVIQHHIDFEANIVNSGYVQFPATPTANIVNIQSDRTAFDMVTDSFGFYQGVTPKGRPDYDHPLLGFDVMYFRATTIASQTATEITYNTAGDHLVADNCYILVKATGSGGYVTLGDVYAVALRVISSTATTVTLSIANDVKVLNLQRKWETVASISYLPTNTDFGTNMWLSIWTSNVDTGNYVFKGQMASFPASSVSYIVGTNVASPTVPASGSELSAFNLAGNLGDIYDVTTVKQPFPALTDEFASLSFCTYGALAMISQGNEIYFSDTSLGGNFEMTTGLAFILVGSGEDGPVQAIQGTTDFMLISRQFKNYYLTGNVPTANYRVSTISATALGAYSNESAIVCLDKILFFNKAGIWALYTGGKCDQVSFAIKGLFETFSNNTKYAEENLWDVSELPTYLAIFQREDPTVIYNKWFKIRFDVSRNLVFFFFAGEDKQGRILVLNMNSGEFYTWRGILYNIADSDFKDMCFIEGNYYLASNGSVEGAVVKVENKEGPDRYDYMAGDWAPQLRTTWFTGGQPSLEKKINQVKMWGLIEGDVSITRTLDWDDNLSSVEDTYHNENAALFSHKWRVNPANALACSISMVIRCDKFELEGLELEFQPFQQGMKK